MKKIIRKALTVTNMLLLAPIKWPTKVAQAIKIIAVGMGIVDALFEKQLEDEAKEAPTPESAKPVETKDDSYEDDE